MSGSKKTIWIIAALAAVLAVGGYFIGGSMMADKEREKIVAFLQKHELTAESVTVAPFGTSVTIEKLSGTLSNPIGAITLAIDKLDGKGINLSAGMNKGVATLVDDLAAQGVVVDFVFSDIPGDPGKTIIQKYSFKELIIKDLRADVHAMANYDHEAFPAGFREAFSSCALGELTFKEYATEMNAPEELGLISSSFALYSLKDITMKGCGPAVWEDMRVSFMGADLITAKRGGGDKIRIPDLAALVEFFAQAGKLAESADATPESINAFVQKGLLDELDNNPLEITNAFAEGISIRPLTQETLDIAKVNGDFFLDTKKVAFAYLIDHVVVPPSIYALGSPESKLLAQVYGKPLDLSIRIDAEALRDGGNGEIIVKNAELSEHNLFRISGEGVFPFKSDAVALPELMEEGAELFLRKLQLNIQDTGAVELSYKARAAGSGQEVDALRNMDMMTLQFLAGGLPNPALQQALTTAGELLQKPGTYTLTFEPESLYPLEDPDPMLFTPEAKFVPAQ